MEHFSHIQTGDSHTSERYKPIQRVNQACQECRKKKARCTGDRPKCQSCRRLSRDCIYPDGNLRVEKPASDQVGQTLVSLLASVQDISARLSHIEQLLHDSGIRAESASTQSTGELLSPRLLSPYPACSMANKRSYPNGSNAEAAGAVPAEQPDNKSERDDSVAFAGLLPLPVILETLDIYFTYCHNQPYSFFHEESFRAKLSQGKIPDHLLFAILASAVRFSKNPFFDDIFETALFYSNKSWRSIVSSCFSANKVADLMTVQTVTLLSILDYTAGRSRHGGAWVKIGLAVRIAQDLRLMLESATHLPYTEQEERRRTFWSIYLLDRLASCGRARPPAILDASCLLQLPCDEVSWRTGVWKETLTLQQLSLRALSQAEKQGPFSHVVAMAYTLSRGAQYMLQQFNMRSQDPPWDANSDFASIQSDLLYLESFLEIHKPPNAIINQYTCDGQVDQHSTGPIIFARALFHLCYCILHHPFLLRHRLDSCPIAAPSSFLSRSFDSAWEHSKRMAALFTEVRQAGAIAQASFYGYCTVVAGTIAALYLHDPSEVRRMEAATLLQMHLSYLEDIGGYWKNVSSMAVALQKFSEDASRFASLSSESRLLEPLGLEDYETLWILVDYSSMSDETRVVLSQASDSDLWLDNNANWQDIFGVIDSSESIPQASHDSTLHTASYVQPGDSYFSPQIE